MKRYFKMLLAGIFASVLIAFPALASDPDFTTDGSGYLTGVSSKFTGDSITVPEEINGTAVIGFEDKFLSGHGIRHVTMATNGMDISADAFFEAKEVEDYTINPLYSLYYAKSGPSLILANYLIDYPSATAKASYTVASPVNTVLSMDNAQFSALDLSNVTGIALNALAGTYADSITLNASLQTIKDGTADQVKLLGLHAGSFSVSGTGSLSTSAGGKILTDGKRIVKIAKDYAGDLTGFSGYTVDQYAFDNMKQCLDLWDKGLSSIAGNTVFYFYNQNNGVFVYNGKISYCYNYGTPIPESINVIAAYDSSVDTQEKIDMITAVMNAGVPNDDDGLFSASFGTDFNSTLATAGADGNPALNVISNVVWNIIDSAENNVEGIGSSPCFSAANVSDYRSRIDNVIANYRKYNYDVEIGTSLIEFALVGSEYTATGFKVNAVDKTGAVRTDKTFSVHFTDSTVKVNGVPGASFNTGDTVTVSSTTLPTSLEVEYAVNGLNYALPSTPGDQHLLVIVPQTAKKKVLTFTKIKISKQAVTGSDELPGATLQILDSGNNIIKEWVSSNAPVEITLSDGTYTLREITAPAGYQKATDISFTVTGGTVPGGIIIMKDESIPPETTVPPETTAPPETTVPETTAPPETTPQETTAAPSSSPTTSYHEDSNDYVPTPAPTEVTLPETEAPIPEGPVPTTGDTGNRWITVLIIIGLMSAVCIPVMIISERKTAK